MTHGRGPVTVDVADWERLCAEFRRFFAGLGRVSADGDRAAFTSSTDTVATGFAIGRDGRLAASMPLHGLEVTGSALVFDPATDTVTLVGDGVRYAYRVPPQLLEQRTTG